MNQKSERILAAGIGDSWYVTMPGLLIGSVLGFLFWSAVIAAVRQVLSLI